MDAAAADGAADAVEAAAEGAAETAADGAADAAADGATDGAAEAAAEGRAEAAAEAAAAADGAALAGTVVLVGVAPPQAAKRMAAAPLAKPPSNVRREMTLPDTPPATVPSLSLRSARDRIAPSVATRGSLLRRMACREDADSATGMAKSRLTLAP